MTWRGNWSYSDDARRLAGSRPPFPEIVSITQPGSRPEGTVPVAWPGTPAEHGHVVHRAEYERRRDEWRAAAERDGAILVVDEDGRVAGMVLG